MPLIPVGLYGVFSLFSLKGREGTWSALLIGRTFVGRLNGSRPPKTPPQRAGRLSDFSNSQSLSAVVLTKEDA
jgi:hypothetical protein